MPRYRLTIEYHGGDYVGWQRQKVGRSIQQTIESALAVVEPTRPLIHGAGRTDAGVHALGQVAHVDLMRNWIPKNLRNAANSNLLGERIAITKVAEVADHFHARFNATERTYLYRLVARRPPVALERGLVWHRPHKLDVAAMHTAGQTLLGYRDFTTFRSSHCQAASAFRTLDEISIWQDGLHISILVRARSFLHRQIRSIVGTLELIGSGKRGIGYAGDVLAARDRSACGPSAPPEGLYLKKVRYDGRRGQDPVAQLDRATAS